MSNWCFEASQSEDASRNASEPDSASIRYLPSDQGFQRSRSLVSTVKNERRQPWSLAGVVGDGACRKTDRGTWETCQGSNLNVVSGLDSKSDVSVGMNPSTGPRTRLERAGPRSGPARSQTWRSGCRVPGHTPSVSTRGVGSADYPPVRIFAAIGTLRGELEERRSHKPGETFSRPNPTLSTPVFVNLRGASRDLPDQRSEFPMRGACRDPTQIHCVEHLASAG